MNKRLAGCLQAAVLSLVAVAVLAPLPASAQTCGANRLDDGGFSWTNCANEATLVTYEFTDSLGRRFEADSCVDRRSTKFYTNPHTVGGQTRHDPAFVRFQHPAPPFAVNEAGSCRFP